MTPLRAMNRAVFLDRDGVINVEGKGYTWRVEDFRTTAGLAESLRRLKEHGFLLVVVSNQSGIAKGIYGHDDVAAVHRRLAALLAAEGVELDDILYCPHHPDHGRCLCRKPEALLLEKALARLHINPAASWLIGDLERDLEAARKAGVQGIHVPTNEGIAGAVSRILNTSHAPPGLS